MKPALLTMGLLANVAMAQNPVSQTAHALDTVYKVQVKLQYLLYLPKGYQDDPSKSWPLLLFLHGAGERGNDLERVKAHGPPKLIAQGREFPFIVVSPQCADKPGWWENDSLLALLDKVQSEYRVDKERVYLTGLSMGGYGTWALATAAPERFAAIVPICGGGQPLLAERLDRMGVWAFHGANDPIVPLSESQRMMDALKWHRDAKFTVYPDAGHDSWTRAYETPELWEWLLKHKR